MDSWSKYTGVVDMGRIEEARAILTRGNEINQMMKVVGEEGTSAEDYIIYQKGELLDAVYLQQNSFDPIDAACSPDRQREEFGILYDALMASYDLDDKNEIRGFFNQLRQEFLDCTVQNSNHRNSTNRKRKSQNSTNQKLLSRRILECRKYIQKLNQLSVT